MLAFQRAITNGDLQALFDVLAPDVVLLADGGGVIQAMPRPWWGPRRWSGSTARCCVPSARS